MPEANTLTVGIMVLLAQQEREMIANKMQAALSELKAKRETREKAATAKFAKALAAAKGAVYRAVS